MPEITPEYFDASRVLYSSATDLHSDITSQLNHDAFTHFAECLEDTPYGNGERSLLFFKRISITTEKDDLKPGSIGKYGNDFTFNFLCDAFRVSSELCLTTEHPPFLGDMRLEDKLNLSYYSPEDFLWAYNELDIPVVQLDIDEVHFFTNVLRKLRALDPKDIISESDLDLSFKPCLKYPYGFGEPGHPTYARLRDTYLNTTRDPATRLHPRSYDE